MSDGWGPGGQSCGLFCTSGATPGVWGLPWGKGEFRPLRKRTKRSRYLITKEGMCVVKHPTNTEKHKFNRNSYLAPEIKTAIL